MTLTFVQRSYQGHVNRCVTFDVKYLGNRQRERFGFKGLPIGNDIWAIEWSRDRWRHVTLKGQTLDPNTLRAQYLENDLSYRLQIWYAALHWEYLAGAQIISLKVGVA